ncbi:Sulfatase maturation enzyme AslB, radical SAM superfamily [Pseudomonas saponiphila]|jgi:sulfatase maturation enzyme AslB (radical SAM superfamily)|uniref:Sulfatase maturation enzyme AslB, radical SAM superfamily n=1 Tax=Pseudomonas saponiphila TaxID=556534 RepID=A0A1H4ZPU4_9PSED|nr:radical SAM protein [Pseudomonas saponiphila]SED32122.1 Sulfatase maturation enzyme AslB, radical SAM superfamily [Pseudomonas saponiphila]
MMPGISTSGVAGRTTFLFQINVTRRCQLRCSHCYILSDKKDTSPDMTEEEFLHVVSGIVEHMKADYNFSMRYTYVDIHVIGGEPSMLGVDFFKSALPKAKAMLAELPQEFSFSIVTNLVTREALEVARLFDKVSTSYERSTRFNKRKQEEIWRSNVQTLMAESKDLAIPGPKDFSVTTALVRPVVEAGTGIIEELTELGFTKMHFGFFIPSGDGDINAKLVQPKHSETAAFYIKALDWYLEHRSNEELWINPCESWLEAVYRNVPLDDVVCPIVHGALDIDSDGRTVSCIEKGGTNDYVSHGNIFEKAEKQNSDGTVTMEFVRGIPEVLTSQSYLKEVASARRLPLPCKTCDERHLCQANCHVLHGQWNGEGECPGFKTFIKYARNLVENHGVLPRSAMKEKESEVGNIIAIG